ncbi:MAG: ankyrin repeat domain-containing protein [Clostridiales bacterium]|nr:ankyrin repeat domain-containing protein [Clostridiales bacterium]
MCRGIKKIMAYCIRKSGEAIIKGLCNGEVINGLYSLLIVYACFNIFFMAFVCHLILSFSSEFLITMRLPLLMRFSRSGNITIVKLLLKFGFDPNIEFMDKTILIEVIESKYMDVKDKVNMLRLLIDNGADVNKKVRYEGGDVPIIIACRQMEIEVIRLLIESGANVNYVDALDESVLMKACRIRCFKVVKILVEHGADVNYIDAGGRSILMEACGKCSLEMVKFLVESGANVSCRNNYSLKIACWNEVYDVAKYLICKGIHLEYNDMPLLFVNMPQIEPRMLCTMFDGNETELGKLMEDYWKENRVSSNSYFDEEIKSIEFSYILKKHVLPKIENICNDLKDDIKIQENLKQHVLGHDEEKLNLKRDKLNNFILIKKKIYKFIDMSNQQLNYKIIRFINISKRIKLERVGTSSCSKDINFGYKN